MAFSCLLYAVTLALAAFSIVEATQIMHRPENYKDAPNRFMIETNPKTNQIQRRATSKANFAYFTNWGIYGANFRKSVFYPFLNIC
jgi:chitinase